MALFRTHSSVRISAVPTDSIFEGPPNGVDFERTRLPQILPHVAQAIQSLRARPSTNALQEHKRSPP